MVRGGEGFIEIKCCGSSPRRDGETENHEILAVPQQVLPGTQLEAPLYLHAGTLIGGHDAC